MDAPPPLIRLQKVKESPRQDTAESPSSMVQRIPRYRLIKQIQKNAHGAVYLARQTHLRRPVVLKFVRPGSPDMIRCFEREVWSLCQLHHPNNVRILDQGRINTGRAQCFYLVTEFAEGCDLRALIDHQGALDTARSISVARQILAGLAEAHALGLLHRDIKPANVIVSQHAHMRDHVRIIDYGMALPEGQQPRWAKAEIDEAIIGTPRYMSPEQLLGQEPSPSSDIYSVGLVLYEMLSGLPAFEGEGVVELMRQQIHDRPPPLSLFVTLPAPLVSIVHKAIQKEPARRYQSVAAFIDALDRVDLTHFHPGFTGTGPHTPVPPAPHSDF